MRRHLAFIVALLVLFSGTDAAEAATVIKVGGACTKAGLIQKSAGKSFVCAKKGAKLAWILISTPAVAKPAAPVAIPDPTPVVTPTPIAIETQAPTTPKTPAELSYLENVLGEPLFTVVGTPNDICQIATTQTNGSGVKQAVTLDDFGKYQFTLTKNGLGTSATVQAKCTKSGEALAVYEAPKTVVKTVSINNFPTAPTPGQVVKYQITGTVDDQCTQENTFPGSAKTTKTITLGKTGAIEATITIGNTTGLWQVGVICKLSGSKSVSAQVAYATVSANISGIPTTMAPGEKFSWTLRATPGDTCDISTTFPGQTPSTQTVTISSSGGISASVTLGSRTGTLIYAVSCAKSGSATAVASVASASAPAPTTPAPTTSSGSRRLTQVCISAGAGVPFETGCQTDSYPFWGLSFCAPRSTSGAWSLYISGTLIQVAKDSGLDSPSMCPDASKPLWITIGSMISSNTLTPQSFLYEVHWVYVSNSKPVTVVYPIRVSVS